MDHALVERLEAWTEAGLLSDEQASSIRSFESDHAEPPQPPQRFGLVAEAAAYLGAVLAFMGGAVVVGSRWEDAALLTRLAIALVIAALGFIAGGWLRRLGEPGTDRLGSLMWVVGTGGAGLMIGVYLHELDARAAFVAIGVGAAVAGLGASLWRNLDRPLQLITMVAGVAIVTGGLADLANDTVWPLGVVGWLLAFGLFVAAATGRARPRLTALATAVVAGLLSSAMLADLDEHVAPIVAAATAAATVVFGLRDQSVPILAIGVVGFLIATQALLATTFTGVASSGIVTLVGLTIVVAAVARSTRGHAGHV